MSSDSLSNAERSMTDSCTSKVQKGKELCSVWKREKKDDEKEKSRAAIFWLFLWFFLKPGLFGIVHKPVEGDQPPPPPLSSPTSNFRHTCVGIVWARGFNTRNYPYLVIRSRWQNANFFPTCDLKTRSPRTRYQTIDRIWPTESDGRASDHLIAFFLFL